MIFLLYNFFSFTILWLDESPPHKTIHPITQLQSNRNCTVGKLYAIIFDKTLKICSYKNVLLSMRCFVYFLKGAYWISSNSSFIQYCNSNFGLFSNAPPLVIALNPFASILKIGSWLFFLYCFPYNYRSSNYCDSNSCRSFTLIKAIPKRKSSHIAIAFKSEKEQ